LAPAEGFARVLTCWETSRVHTEQTMARMSETVQRFVARLDAQGVTGLGEVTQRHVAAFVAAATTDGAAPELATQHARRTSVRTFYRTLRELGIHRWRGTQGLSLAAVPADLAFPTEHPHLVHRTRLQFHVR
jgi:site-specific recombinase XerD